MGRRARRVTRRPTSKKAKPPDRPGGTAGLRRLTPKSVRQIDRAMRRLEQAYRYLEARGGEVLALAHQLEAASAERRSGEVAKNLAERSLLRDILSLRHAFAEVPDGSLPAALEGLRGLPDALLYWVETSLHVTPTHDRHSILEVPAGDLGDFKLEGDARPTSHLTRLRILEPGWKRGAQILTRPVARLL